MLLTILISHWKSLFVILLFLLVIFLSSLCFTQYKELSLFEKKLNAETQMWEKRIQEINKEGKARQQEYDLLEQQHKFKVEALNEKIRQQKVISDNEYSVLINANHELHKTIRDTTTNLSNLSREAAIDYSKRASEALKECSDRYIEVAKAADDLGIDRDALEDAFPNQSSK